MTENSHLKVKNFGNLATIAEQFASQRHVVDIQPLGNGNINDTYLVTQDPQDTNDGEKFILQRINTRVFSQPALVMQNMRIFTEHAQDRLQRNPLRRDRRWEVPQVLMTQDDRDYYIDSGGSFWRAIGFIGNSYSLDAIQNLEHAREVGYALGTFHSLIGDLPPEKLVDTLEGFHITPRYLRHYEAVIAKADNSASKSPEVQYCLRFISDRTAWAHVLEDAKAKGKLPLRLMHGDPKVNNVMIDTTTQQAVSMIDLDTVKPGLVHYDIGDCLRSGCNPLGEETDRLESVCFESDLCQAILLAYLAETREFLTEHDYDYMYDAIRLLAFELGLRFFTDHLAGNVYFKVAHPEHNLTRALVQFKLVESIESQEATIRTIIQDVS